MVQLQHSLRGSDMPYNKQEVKKSEEAYNSAKNLSRKLNGVLVRDGARFVQLMLDFFGGVALCVLFMVAIYGTAGKFGEMVTNLSNALPYMGIAVAPAIGFRLIRAATRAAVSKIISRKYEKGRLYLEYRDIENQKPNAKSLSKAYIKGIDKIIEMANSNDKAGINAEVENLKKAEKEFKVSKAEEEYIEEALLAHVQRKARSLSVAQKEQLAKVFNDLGRC